MTRIPLAERMRPQTLDEVIGQTHLLGDNEILRKIVDESDTEQSVMEKLVHAVRLNPNFEYDNPNPAGEGSRDHHAQGIGHGNSPIIFLFGLIRPSKEVPRSAFTFRVRFPVCLHGAQFCGLGFRDLLAGAVAQIDL